MATTYIPELVIAKIQSFIDLDTSRYFRLVNKMFKLLCSIPRINVDKIEDDTTKFKWFQKIVDIALATNNHDTLCQMELLFHRNSVHRYMSLKKIKKGLSDFLEMFLKYYNWILNETYLLDINIDSINIEFKKYSYSYEIEMVIYLENDHKIKLNYSIVDIIYCTNPHIYTTLFFKNQYTQESKKNLWFDDNILEYDLDFGYKESYDKYDDYEEQYFNKKK
jgi:hypothetical protein